MNNNKILDIKRATKAAFPHTIPVLTGFVVLGMAYGILMQTKGYGVLWSTLMSGIAFCGSMQFVAITSLTTAFNPIQAFLLSILVNARHLFYGISMLDKYKGMRKSRFFLIYLLCDETFSISYIINPSKDVNKKYFYLAISFLDYSYWVIGTFIGGMLAKLIYFNTKGLDFALTALFVVLFVEQLKHRENRFSGLVGFVFTFIGLIIFKADNLVIPSMLMILVVLLVWRKLKCI
jgi:4-azaleucine resistance transporter AzlC